MSAAPGRRPLQVFRVASLVLPSAVAWEVATMALHRTRLDDAVAHVLAPLWIATLGALVVRAVDAHARRLARPPELGLLDAIDVLTATGSSMAWTGAIAVVAAVALGWTSLSFVGLLGLSALHLVALWTLVRAGGYDPWRRASLARRFAPGALVEGEAALEELAFEAPRIPAGFRLLASGRVGPRWPVSRYVVEAGDSSGEIVLQRDLGPAVRGTHDAEPLLIWLQDVLGLCHSPRIRAGAARLTVLPRPAKVDASRHLLSIGGSADEPRSAVRLPTQGSFRLREYQPGDDVRRIHWLRSLTANEIVVRLPDELPPDQPSVRVVLDTFHPGLASREGGLACTAQDDLLDGLVRVWLGVAQELALRGVRVTLVTATGANGELSPAQRPLTPRSMGLARALGAGARWQYGLRPADLVGDEPAIVVSHRLPLDDAEAAARWIVVPSALWTVPPAPRREGASLLLAFPVGSADNRASRRRHLRAVASRKRADHEAFRVLTDHPQARRAGHLLARPSGPGEVRLEVLS